MIRFALHSSAAKIRTLFGPLSQNTTVPNISSQLRLPSFIRSFISTQKTPNPNSLKFLTGKKLVESGPFDFPSAHAALVSPLASGLFRVTGVTGVFISQDYVTVTKLEEVDWSFIKPDLFQSLMEFLSSGKPVMDEEKLRQQAAKKDAEPRSELVELIIELLETRIRPSVQEDGGDIQFERFEDGVVYLRMMGSCSGCPSSSLTLKSGIENMLKHYVPEVTEVREVKDNETESGPVPDAPKESN